MDLKTWSTNEYYPISDDIVAKIDITREFINKLALLQATYSVMFERIKKLSDLEMTSLTVGFPKDQIPILWRPDTGIRAGISMDCHELRVHTNEFEFVWGYLDEPGYLESHRALRSRILKTI